MSRISSLPRGSKDNKSSVVDSNIVPRKSKPITPKGTPNSEKETNERRSSGKQLTTKKGKSLEAEQALPSKDKLQKTIVQMFKKDDLEKATFSDILKMLDDHYKMDLSPIRETVKSMVYDEVIKLAEADED